MGRSAGAFGKRKYRKTREKNRMNSGQPTKAAKFVDRVIDYMTQRAPLRSKVGTASIDRNFGNRNGLALILLSK